VTFKPSFGVTQDRVIGTDTLVDPPPMTFY